MSAVRRVWLKNGSLAVDSGTMTSYKSHAWMASMVNISYFRETCYRLCQTFFDREMLLKVA